MTGGMKERCSLKDLALVVIFAVCGTAGMVYLDAFDWFYRHSRRLEAYDYDELVVFLFLFLLIGMLRLVFCLYKEATRETAGRGKAGEYPDHPETWPGESRQPPPLPGIFESLQRAGLPLPDSYRSPLLLLISLTMVIAVAETLDMFVLQLLPPMSVYTEALIDAALLLTIISPALYFIFFRPLVRQFIMRERVEQELRESALELESRIAQRTAQLQAELAERQRVEERLIKNQRQLRALASELSLVEERERRRIATDLHDNIGQALAMATNQLGLLKASIPTDQGKKLLDGIKGLIKESIRYSRALTAELSPPLFSTLPFVSAVEWLAEEILEKQGMEVRLKGTDVPVHLADGDRVLMLKALQETFMNIIKHAKAGKVEIDFHPEDNKIVVAVKDDGIGFDADALSRAPFADGRGLGIFIMQERLTHLHGHFSVTSKPGQGTTVTLAVPMEKNKLEEDACK